MYFNMYYNIGFNKFQVMRVILSKLSCNFLQALVGRLREFPVGPWTDIEQELGAAIT
ncbi:hypothetical protein LNTAR_09244 [Lentisphaera araneosa HTCC2155]|uniref:Uncharacterized protein n=1 Tax=Lentisphaera araneosa HTCC2155 TaxID=313628 RepID=A6DI90_9BACT|nr:hypothetical protein LNTAR_09244 [Lentisphaera araneosa HTCC2155]